MASSFASQIPAIVHLITKLNPKTVLDIGKGFGKYAFLIHEYVGINNKNKIDPTRKMKQQSNIQIDAVEVDPDLMLPHLSEVYTNIYFGDVNQLYKELPKYDVVLMIDIIEHIEKEGAVVLLKHLIGQGSKIIVSTPITFFEQQLYESSYEDHISHWTIKDFKNIGFIDVQYVDSSAIYLISPEKEDIIGFGNSMLKKVKRIARAIKNEF
jgi:2-polyprenyl-3-methyl-5-hydroxy-6-metoxy-1,4-benzoquinol methylase